MSHPFSPRPNTIPEASEEQARCFECNRMIAPPVERGLEVAEGVVLCADCCQSRSRDHGGMHERWEIPEWFDDLAGSPPHA
jgi:hypothetical protein